MVHNPDFDLVFGRIDPNCRIMKHSVEQKVLYFPKIVER
jgi:hypothetical protein